MNEISSIIKELKTNTHQYMGFKWENGNSTQKPINQWTLKFQDNNFVYEQVYFSEADNVQEHAATIKMVFTEEELINLFTQQQNRYFYNARLN
jgi:hypothetical protein